MRINKEDKIILKQFYKNSTINIEEFNRLWLDLVNQLEKKKRL